MIIVDSVQVKGYCRWAGAGRISMELVDCPTQSRDRGMCIVM